MNTANTSEKATTLDVVMAITARGRVLTASETWAGQISAVLVGGGGRRTPFGDRQHETGTHLWARLSEHRGAIGKHGHGLSVDRHRASASGAADPVHRRIEQLALEASQWERLLPPDGIMYPRALLAESYEYLRRLSMEMYRLVESLGFDAANISPVAPTLLEVERGWHAALTAMGCSPDADAAPWARWRGGVEVVGRPGAAGRDALAGDTSGSARPPEGTLARFLKDLASWLAKLLEAIAGCGFLAGALADALQAFDTIVPGGSGLTELYVGLTDGNWSALKDGIKKIAKTVTENMSKFREVLVKALNAQLLAAGDKAMDKLFGKLAGLVTPGFGAAITLGTATISVIANLAE